MSHVLSGDDTEYLLTQKFVKLNFADLSGAGVSFFEFYFRWVNWKHNKFEQSSNVEYPGYRVLSFELIGIKEIWRIALEARDDSVGKKAIGLLNNLYKNFSPELRQQQAEQREEYVKTCMIHLDEAIADASNNDLKMLNPANNLRVARCLELLRTFLEEFELKLGVANSRHGYPTSTSKPITVKVNLSNQKFDVNLKSSDTVRTLRSEIATRADCRAEQIRVFVFGHEVTLEQDDLMLEQVKITDGTHAMVQKRPVVPQRSNVAGPSSSNTTAGAGQLNNHFSNSMVGVDIYPSQILSKQSYFDKLFDLLNFEQFVDQVRKRWTIVLIY